MPPKRDKESASDSSDSSSAEEEVKKPAAKKPKVSSESGLRVDDAEDPTWQIDKMRKVTVREFKGKAYIDIREFYEKDGKTLPGKKGISLTPQQYEKFKSIMPEIEDALKDI